MATIVTAFTDKTATQTGIQDAVNEVDLQGAADQVESVLTDALNGTGLVVNSRTATVFTGTVSGDPFTMTGTGLDAVPGTATVNQLLFSSGALSLDAVGAVTVNKTSGLAGGSLTHIDYDDGAGFVMTF